MNDNQPLASNLKKNENGFIFRRLEKTDLSESYFQLLARLTTSPYPAENLEEMNDLFQEVEKNPYHHIIVIEDKSTGQVIGTGTLLIEKKFIRGISKAGHIEDIVIREDYGGKGLGKELIKILVDISEGIGCYKTILDCSEECQLFYEKCEFEKKGIQMSKYV